MSEEQPVVATGEAEVAKESPKGSPNASPAKESPKASPSGKESPLPPPREGAPTGGDTHASAPAVDANPTVGRKCFVGNLPYELRREDLERKFEPCGKVEDVFLKTNYGFVTMDTAEAASKAVDTLNGTYLSEQDDRPIVVEIAKAPRQRLRAVVKGLSYSTTWQTLKDHFNRVVPVQYANIFTDYYTGQSKGVGVVEFGTDDEMQRAIEAFDNTEFEGRTIFVSVDRQLPRGGGGGRGGRGGGRGGYGGRGGGDRGGYGGRGGGGGYRGGRGGYGGRGGDRGGYQDRGGYGGRGGDRGGYQDRGSSGGYQDRGSSGGYQDRGSSSYASRDEGSSASGGRGGYGGEQSSSYSHRSGEGYSEGKRYRDNNNDDYSADKRQRRSSPARGGDEGSYY